MLLYAHLEAVCRYPALNCNQYSAHFHTVFIQLYFEPGNGFNVQIV